MTLTRRRPSCPHQAWLLLLGLALPLPACGKRGDPQPPLPRTPKPITALRVSQRGGELEISYLVPRTTTAGVVLPVVEVQILRADAEGDITKVGRMRTRRAAPGEALVDKEPLPAAGTKLRFAVRAVSRGKPSPLSEVVAVDVVAQPPGPLALKAQVTVRGVALTWQGVLPPLPPTPSPSPAASPAAPVASPAAPASSPAAPASPAVPAASPAVPAASPAVPAASPAPPAASPAPPVTSPAPPAASLAPPKPAHSGHSARKPPAAASPTPQVLAASSGSKPPAAAAALPAVVPSLSGFFVYRRAPEGQYAAPLMPNPIRAMAYEDSTAKPGENWCYVVRSAASTVPFVESAASNEVCQAVTDVEPPGPPLGLQVQLRDDGAHLVWSPSPERDVVTYEVYRVVAGSDPESIARVGAAETSFVDTAPPPGKRLQYLLRAADSSGNWSQLSRPVEVRR